MVTEKQTESERERAESTRVREIRQPVYPSDTHNILNIRGWARRKAGAQNSIGSVMQQAEHQHPSHPLVPLRMHGQEAGEEVVSLGPELAL